MSEARVGASVAISVAAGLVGALVLSMIGYAPVVVAPVAWLLAVSVGAVHAGLRRGAIWVEHRTIGSIVAVGNLVLLADLSMHGPQRFASEHDVASGRPVTVGVLGYQLGLDETGKLSLELGPDPSVAPKVPYLSVPDIPGQSEGTHATNSPVRIDVACTGEQCRVELQTTGVRRDFMLGMRAGEREEWQIAGAVDIPARGFALRLRERAELGGTLGSPVDVGGEPFLERTIPIEIDTGQVRFGDCEIPFGTEPIYLPLLEFRFIDTTGGCRLKLLTDEDHLRGRWLSRARDGSIQIPAHSLLEIAEGRVRWFPLEDHNLAVSVVSASGEVLALPTPQLNVRLGDQFELALFRRDFREIRLGEALRNQCAETWQARGEGWLQRRPTGCRQLQGRLYEQGFVATLTKSTETLLEIRADRGDPRWGHQLFVDIPPASWTTDDAELPRRHVLLSGRWPQGASHSSTTEEFLALPLRLHGTTPYRAVITFEHRLEDDGVTMWIADALRRGEVSADRAELTLGPPGAQAIIAYEHAPSPWRLARSVLWPTLTLALALALLSFMPGTSLGAAASRVAALGSCVLLVVGYGLLQKSLIAYTIVVHAPHDWKAYDQLLSSAIVLPAMIALAGGIALVTAAFRQHRVCDGERTARLRRRMWGVLAAVLVLAVLGRTIGSVLGREALSGLRFVSLTPLLAAAFWACSMGARSHVRHRGLIDAVTVMIGGGLVFSWWTDKGAMLLLAVPISMGMIPLLWRRQRLGTLFTWTCAGSFALIFLFPQLFIEIWSGSENMQIPALSVAQSSACSIEEEEEVAASIDAQCRTSVSSASALETLERAGVLDASASISTRRHPLRGLDWMEDGAQYSECDAVDRFATRDAMEVGFFRAVSEQYRGTEPRYLRADLLPFSPGVTNALLNDYVGVVGYLPQMPRGAFSAMAMMIAALFLIGLGHGRPWSSLAGSAGIGAAGLLLGASVLTVAANLDGFPNFAQSVPLLALRSGSALLLDALALFTMMLGLALHTSEAPKSSAT